MPLSSRSVTGPGEIIAKGIGTTREKRNAKIKK
jgi:hypothetical protein